MRFLLASLVLVGCGTYNFNRAALVPRAVPRMTTGQPLSATGQLDAGASSVTSLGRPEAGDPNAGIEVPSTQLHGALKLRTGEHASLGLIYENGLAQGAEKLKDTQPDVKGGGVQGYGFTFDVSIPTGNPDVRIGLGVDAILWSVPYVEYLTCAAGESCFPFQIQNKGRDTVGQLAASITPSYKVSPELTLFGGVTMRQHPTIEAKGTTQDPLFTEPDVQSGPLNFLVSAGGEVSFADGAVLASGMLYWNATQTPAKYKGGLGVMMSVPLGRRGPKPPVPSVILVPQPLPGQYPYPTPAPYPPPAPFPPPGQ